jgi:hypothetical protein
MPYIPLQALLRPTLSIEQSILIETFYNRFDNGDAHKKILNVEPLYFFGGIGGTEFLTYVNTKLYICYCLQVNDVRMESVAAPLLTVKDEGDNNILLAKWTQELSNMTSYSPSQLPIILNNLYFSRIIASNYDTMKFIGYRVTLT